MRSRSESLILLLLCAGLTAPACSRSSTRSDSAIPVARRIPVACLCAHSNNENFIAAYTANKQKWEEAKKAILNLKRELRDSDTEALDRVSAAETIDIAISLRDFPNKTGEFAAAYDKHANTIEGLVASSWKTLDPTMEQIRALREVTFAQSREDAATFKKAYTPALTGQFATMYLENQRKIESILGPRGSGLELDSEESRAMALILNGQLIDVANAAIASDPVTRAPSISEAYAAGEEYLRSLAQRKPNDKVSAEEQKAVCWLLRAYQDAN